MLSYVPRTARTQTWEDYLYDRDLTKARNKMKIFADRRRSERTFDVGGTVLLKLKLYRQSTARGVMLHKLSPRYYGLYLIIEKIGIVAYRLQLPPSTKIHSTISRISTEEIQSEG